MRRGLWWAALALAACGEPADGREIIGEGLRRVAVDEVYRVCWQQTHAGAVEVAGGRLEVQRAGIVDGDVTVDAAGTAGVEWGQVVGVFTASDDATAEVRYASLDDAAAVESGGSLAVLFSEVGGPVTATDAASLTVSQSTLGATVTVNGCDAVELFDTDVSGDVIIDGCDDVNLEFLRVDGSVTITNATTCRISNVDATNQASCP